MIEYLRETSPFYVYSNPIAPGEAGAAAAAVALVDSPTGREKLSHLHAMTKRFRDGLKRLKLETIAGVHPIVPLMVRDSARTASCLNRRWRFAHLPKLAATKPDRSYPG